MRIVFTAIVHFIPSAQGRNYGIILTRPFSIQLSHSQICVLCVCGLKTRFQPFQLATLVCSPARCGYLTPYSIAPKRTGEFLIFQASKIGFPQKRLFVSRSRRSLLFCFLILFFTIYFFIRFSPYLFAVCLAFEYMTIIKPFFRTAKLFEKKNLERSKNSLFANMERTRAKMICK